MLSRALSLATVTLLIGCLAAIPVRAQNLEAGKSPSQIFSGTCAACHKAPRGLLKTVPAGSLPGFLRQHYTTSSEMASLLAAFLISNGAADPRYVGSKPTQQPKDVKPPEQPAQLDRFGRPIRPAASSQEAARPDAQPQQAARPDADGLTPQGEPGRAGRNAKRHARPGEAPDAAKPAADGQPAQAATETGPDGRKAGAKQKLSKRGKPEEAVKPDVAKPEPAKPEPATSEPATSEPAKDETAKEEGSKPSGDGKSEAAKIGAPKETGGETPALRADPVPRLRRRRRLIRRHPPPPRAQPRNRPPASLRPLLCSQHLRP